MFRYKGEILDLKSGVNSGTLVRQGETESKARERKVGTFEYCLGVVGERSSGDEGQS